VPVPIRSRALDVLAVLVEQAGRLVSKDYIIAAVWPETVVEESNLTVQISALRRVLDRGPSEGSCIQTVVGRGYRFAATVTRRGAHADLVTGTVPASVARPALSIVVLPFVNLSDDPQQEYLAHGITDDLTTDFSRVHGSFVIASSTAFTYRGKPNDVKQVGRELGVRYVVEGSVRRAGEVVRINAQLIDTESGAHLWADRFETKHADFAEGQSEITARLARTLSVAIVDAAARRIDRESLADPDARDLMIRGRAWHNRPTSAVMREERQHAFERALEIDPHSLDAKIGLASVLVQNCLDGFTSSSGETRAEQQARAEQLLLDALERDPNRAEAHEAMGRLRRFQNRLTESRLELETAIALDPEFAQANFQLGITLVFLGHPETTIALFEKEMRLNPRYPNIWSHHHWLGTSYLLLGELDKATDLLRQALGSNPRVYYVHLHLASALALKGDLDEAHALLAEGLKLKPEINSLAALRRRRTWGNPQYWALCEKTLHAGLRRAGMPEE
jgi:TolB-like protein/Flp pilus assembly protein TadD